MSMRALDFRTTRFATLGIIAAMLTVSIASRTEAQYRLAVNHGTGWREAPGDYATLVECNQEAAAYARRYSAQAGCAEASALQRYWAGVQAQQERHRMATEFQQAADKCARRSGVSVIHKPDAAVKILGTAKERFAFEKCMAKSGQPTE
jgi:hypothetical protein